MARRSDDIRARLLATFRVEAGEHLGTLTANLLALERGLPAEQAQEVVQTTFRAMHTLKGAARSVGLLDVEGLCQASELLLSRIAQGRVELTPALVDRLQEAVDAISALLAGRADPEAVRELAGRLEAALTGAGESEAEPRQPWVEAKPAEPAPADTIRLDAGKLDALLREGEQLLAAKLASEERVREARALVAELGRARERQDVQEAAAGARALLERLVRDRHAIGVAVDRLLEETRRARMTPASTVLDLFPRMVRDLGVSQAKDVQWAAHGAGLEIDRKVLETVKDPLIHLVRNAVDHGIEPPEARVAAGKSRRGRVSVTVSSLEDGRVEIVVDDDGRGIDPDQVRDAAVRGRLVTADAARALSDDEALELALRSGLSTSPVITDVSGHGLGLAIVRERVEALEGEVHVESSVGTGTRVRLVLPSSIATFRGLLVRSAGRLFLLPIAATEHVLALDEGDVRAVEGRQAIGWNGDLVPVARLDAVLQLQSGEGGAVDERKPSCVIVRASHERVGILVDEMLGEREVLLKELRPPLVRVPHVAGAGLLGAGSIVLVLRAADIVKAGRRAYRPAAPRTAAVDERRQPLVLVVDDAVTTRTMERNLLEAAGYRVEVAVDGMEAWTALKTDDFDLVVSDVDMPRMDGFELTERIRGDARLSELPVVLVTALESREDKERGVEVGANAYVVKSSFEQSNLLDIIKRLGVVAAAEALG